MTQKKEKPQSNLVSEYDIQDHESCEHVFMPIDSTNEILSCIKCGVLIRRDELKNKNFFVQGELSNDLT